MDYHVRWSPEALEDIESIAEYIARDSAFYAQAVVAKLLVAARSLPEAPRIGRMVPELDNPNIRERLIYSYRMVYRISDDELLIIAVMHGKRLLENMDDRFD